MNGSGEKLGIALGGGGSLGSYEMGVWEALRALKMEPEIITGTSIGALIGAFMATDKFEVGQALWHNVTPDKVMRDGLNFQWDAIRKTFLHDRKRILTFTKSYIRNRGADISPLVETIKASLIPAEIKQTRKRFGVVAVELPFLSRRNIDMRKVPEDEIVDWLLASSAIWPLFPIKTIKRKQYIDGGYKDTLPIKFAFDLGATKIIAVNLFYKIAWHPFLNRRPDVVNIEPSWDLGAPFNFDQAAIDRNRALGFNDAMKKLGGYPGYRYTFTPEYDPGPLSQRLDHLINDHFGSLAPMIRRRLKRHTGGHLKEERLFIRGLEVLAETLKIDPTKIYAIPELARLCYETVDARFEIPAIVALLKKLRGLYPLSDQDERKAIGAIKYAIENHYHEKDILQFAARKATHALIYLMMVLIYQNFVKTNEDKGGTGI